jgi:predicted GNAT family acetyltransferase
VAAIATLCSQDDDLMIEDFAVEHETGSNGGRYVIRLPDGKEAEMTYASHGAGVIVADHTYVPPAFRGKGLAEMLVNRAMLEARRTGTKIVPLCSYVAAQFRRHPEWADLRA